MNLEQIIIYFMIAIVLIGGVTFGLSTVNKIQQKQDLTIKTKFMFDFKKYIDNTKDNYGKVMIGDFKLPNDMTICFADLESTENLTINNTIIRDSVENKIGNYFLVQNTQKTESYMNTFIRLNNKTLCVDKQAFKLRFTGQGNSTKIEVE